MIHLLGQTKHLTAVAVSGGIDSMAALSFLRRSLEQAGETNKPSPAACNGQKLKAIYFNHNTIHGVEAEKFVIDYCQSKNIQLILGKIITTRSTDLSWEEFWRIERYKFFSTLLEEKIVVAHHLNDVAETYIWSFIHGFPKIIPYFRKPNVYRPFLLTPKQQLADWCRRKAVPHIEDPSNEDVSYTRNQIRHTLFPEVIRVNPGYLKTVARETRKKYATSLYG